MFDQNNTPKFKYPSVESWLSKPKQPWEMDAEESIIAQQEREAKSWERILNNMKQYEQRQKEAIEKIMMPLPPIPGSVGYVSIADRLRGMDRLPFPGTLGPLSSRPIDIAPSNYFRSIEQFKFP